MKVLNVHEREMQSDAPQVGALIDSLASPKDALWPSALWPPMKFDRSLSVGAVGGHGPIGYIIEEYLPGQAITFRFTRPSGFGGFHRFEAIKGSRQSTILRHHLQMDTSGIDTLLWLAVIRPMHDALIEDSFATAQISLGLPAQLKMWSPWVRLLRLVLSGGKARSQKRLHIRPSRP